MNQKIFFGFLVMVTLTLQGCGINPSRDTDNDMDTPTKTIQTTVVTGNVDTTTGGATTNTNTETVPSKTPAATGADQTALNGTYHLTATYDSPAGDEPLDVTVALKANVITTVEVKNVAHAPMSKNFQDKFASGIAGQIVGKNIKDVNVTYVNGSSLTAQAFNKALHALQN